ncbi:hypothetical protein BMT54_04845 [Pasteurellaceae bacterium 15-036681]|nr:hypothetical protein BMT54_04845 [Pasteurellaceae bacterium 15-036681]
MQNNNTQLIEVFLDYATLPSLNYLINFASHKEDRETIRLFGLARFNISDEIIDSYPQGKLHFVPVNVSKLEDFKSKFKQILEDNIPHKKVKLNFHFNLFHSLEMLTNMLGVLTNYLSDIVEVKLNFYDDGSEGIVSLYKLANTISKDELIYHIEHQKEQINQFLSSGKLEFSNSIVLRYLWGNLFSSHYHLIRSDYIKEEKLAPLQNAISSYQELEIDSFQRLSNEAKHFMFQLLQLDFNEISPLLSNKGKSFLFLGTTVNTDNLEITNFANKLHLDYLQQFISPDGKFYIGEYDNIYFKAHPNSKQVNKLISDNFKNIVILPNNIPMEILLFLGLNITMIGGFSSTLFFYLHPENIHHVIFMTEDKNKDKAYSLEIHYWLKQSLIGLGNINEQQAHEYTEIYNIH